MKVFLVKKLRILRSRPQSYEIAAVQKILTVNDSQIVDEYLPSDAKKIKT